MAKAEGTKNQLPATALETLIIAYTQTVVDSKNREKSHPELDTLVGETIDKIQKRNKDFDANWMLHSLYRIYSWKTFESSNDAEHLKQDLEAFSIEVPGLVQNCFQEIEMRRNDIKRYAEGKAVWDNTKIEEVKKVIEAEAAQHSYDTASKLRFLDGLFVATSDEIKRLEKETARRYGYFINNFFKDGKFVATEGNINDLYFYGEMHAGGYENFYSIALDLSKYIDKHNELGILRSMLTTSDRNEPATREKKLEDIFAKPEYFKLCRDLLIEYDVIDSEGRTILKQRGHGYLHAIINALKSQVKPLILNRRDYTDDQLREYFSVFLGVNVGQVKRGKYATGYNEKEKEAIKYFNARVNGK
jgi:hypothetical protein